MRNYKYLSNVRLVCFDGNEPVADPATGLPTGNPASPAPARTYTQQEVESLLAAENRKSDSRLKAELEKREKNLETQLASNRLTEQERNQLQEQLEDVRKQSRTKEAQAAHEKKQLEESHSVALKGAEERATHWENQFRVSTIHRAISDAAASNDGVRPDVFVTHLKDYAKLIEVKDPAGKTTGEFEVVIDLPDTDPNTGERIITQRTPDEAVKRMRELPETWGFLFKSNLVSGVGGTSGVGILGGALQNGQVKVKGLSSEQYMELRKRNPAAVGRSDLRPRGDQK